MGTNREPQALQWASSLEGIDSASLREIVDVDPVSLQKIVTAIAAAQKTLRSERSRTGLVAARQRGQRLGRPPAMTETQIALARRMMAEGMTRKIIARTLKVSRSTLYIALKTRPAASNPKHPSSGRAPPATPKLFRKRNKPPPRTSFALLAALLLPLLLFFALPAHAQTAGGACSTTGIETAGEEGVMVCNSSDVWELALSWSATSSYGYIVPNIGNDSGSCTTAKTGELIYNGTAFEYCSGTAWTSFGTNLNNVDVELAAGSAAAPSLSFYSDTNTGLYQAASHTINFSTNGVEVGAFDATGNFDLTNASNTSAGAYQLNAATVLTLPQQDTTSLAVGSQALANQSTGNYYNTAIGHQALYASTNSQSSTAVGVGALYNNNGNANTAVGVFALLNNTTGAGNIAIGDSAMLGQGSNPMTGGGYNVAIGNSALQALGGGSQVNIAVGNSALYSLTNGNASIAIGYGALYDTTNSPNDALGFQAGEYITTGTHNIAIGFEAMEGSSGSPITGNYNTAVGDYAFAASTTSSDTAIGYNTLPADTGYGYNTALGYEAGENLMIGYNNVAIGYQTMGGSSATPITGNFNTAVGNYAFAASGASDDTAIGYNTLPADTGFGLNTAVGYEAGEYITTGNDNVAIGMQAMQGSSAAPIGGNRNTVVGNYAYSSSSASYDVAIGYNALNQDSGYGNNVAVGYQAGLYITTGFNNIAIGLQAMQGSSATPVTGNFGTAVGDYALGNSTGSSSTALGYCALCSTTGGPNMGLGYFAGEYVTSGTDNIAIGYNAMVGTSANPLTAATAGNIAIGDWALQAITGGAAGNVAVGFSALSNSTVNGTNPNTALGYEAGQALTTGTDNTLIGYKSGYGVKGSHNIILGEDPSSAITTGGSNILIGNSLSNVTNSSSTQLDIGDLIMGSISGSTPEVGIGTTSYQGQGLTVSGDVWATIFQMTSDARLKTDIRPLADALSRIAQVKGVTYEWKPPEAREIGKDMSLPLNQPQMGVLAQDVEAVFPEAVTTGPNGLKSVNYESLAAPLIEAVKTLKRQNEVLMAAVGLLYVALVVLTVLFAALAVLFLLRLRQTRIS